MSFCHFYISETVLLPYVLVYYQQKHIQNALAKLVCFLPFPNNVHFQIIGEIENGTHKGMQIWQFDNNNELFRREGRLCHYIRIAVKYFYKEKFTY